ncbi:MAG: HYR domain-containing protein [Saprospiraceae bacterium]|nr:HYR domain-containing protein [Saprospiraceae bacterium]
MKNNLNQKLCIFIFLLHQFGVLANSKYDGLCFETCATAYQEAVVFPYLIDTLPCNRVLNFDGQNDFTASNSPLIGNKAFTVEVWFKSENSGLNLCTTSDLKNFKWLFSWVGELFGVGECGGKLALIYQPLNVSGNHFVQNLPVKFVNDQKWHHLAIGYDNQTGGDIWFDGVLLASLGANQFPFSEFFRLGSKFNQEGLNWKGSVDEFRIWDHKRTALEIRTFYQCRLDGNEKGLITYYSMEQGTPEGDNTSIKLLEDFSTRNNAGQITNFALNKKLSNFICSDSSHLDTTCLEKLCDLDFTYVVTNCNSVKFTSVVKYYPNNENLEFLWEGKDFNFSSSLPNPTYVFLGNKEEYEICLTVVSNYCRKTVCKKVKVMPPQKPVFNNCPGQFLFYGCTAELDIDVTAIDPCTEKDPFTFSFKRSDLKSFDDPYPQGTTQLIFYATTLSGLTDSCVVTVEVKDTISPVCNTQLIERYLNQSGSAFIETSELAQSFFDNCGKVVFENTKLNFECKDIGKEKLFAFKIRDEAGNERSCNYPILIKDTIPPEIVVQDLIADAGDLEGAYVDYAPNIFDNCPGVTQVCNIPSGSFFKCGTHTVICTATDLAGNSSTDSFYITVNGCESCCKDQNQFNALLQKSLNILPVTTSTGVCLVQLFPPKLKDCQYITQLRWDDGTITNGLFPDSLEFIHEYFQPGTYDICVRITEDKDRKCFIGEICKTISVNEDCNIVSGTVHNLFQKISLAPNPVYNEFYLHSEAKVEKGIIHDITGRSVFVIKDMSSQIIDVSFLSPGIYWLSLTLHDGSTKNLSFIKQ